MEKTIQIISRMKSENLFSDYAIGGEIAALFYIEPVATFDLDIFIILPNQIGTIISLTPLYTWLADRGYRPDKEQVVIEGVPVQFIPAYNELVEDAVRYSSEKKYGEVQTKVLSAEYLMAIMLQTYRPKDKERLIRFMDQATFSEELLESILLKFDLKDIYIRFMREYHGK
jgi:hypothetical protein